MFTIRFYVGENFDAIGFSRRELVPVFGGATVTASHGFWTAPDGRVFDEKGHIITLVTDSPEATAMAIKSARRQAAATGEESVMVEMGNGEVLFEDAKMAWGQ
jgi:hypothetical protein